MSFFLPLTPLHIYLNTLIICGADAELSCITSFRSLCSAQFCKGHPACCHFQLVALYSFTFCSPGEAFYPAMFHSGSDGGGLVLRLLTLLKGAWSAISYRCSTLWLKTFFFFSLSLPPSPSSTILSPVFEQINVRRPVPLCSPFRKKDGQGWGGGASHSLRLLQRHSWLPAHIDLWPPHTLSPDSMVLFRKDH